MKIVCVSDTHGHTPDLPDGDVLIVAGDMFPITDHNDYFQRNFIRTRFYPWLAEYDYSHILWVPGNHDFICEKPGFGRIVAEGPMNLHFLVDKGIEIDGIKFYGFPWVPNLRGWAFHGDDPLMVDRVDEIPMDTDVLISHGPPSGILDNKAIGYGCTHLAARVNRVLPKYHVFGHIHEDYGAVAIGDVTFMNVAYLDDDYQPVPGREIQVFDYRILT